jgi:hypothetical protein
MCRVPQPGPAIHLGLHKFGYAGPAVAEIRLTAHVTAIRCQEHDVRSECMEAISW